MICAITPGGRGNAPVASGAAKYSASIHVDRPGAEIIGSIKEMDARVGAWHFCTGDDAGPT
jgi:hypothetical protein